MRVLLVSEHHLLQNMLHIALEREGEIEIVGEFLEGDAALEAAARTEPELVILGMELADMSGVTLTERLHRERGDLHILAVTGQKEEKYLIPFLLAGGHGYMSRYPSDEEFYRAVSDVMAGRIYLNGAGIDVLTQTLQQLAAMREQAVGREVLPREVVKSPGPQKELSDREKQVLHLYVNGYTSGEIGEILYMSANTVETHKKRIKEKLQLFRKAELTQYARQNRLLEDWD